jgi:predicted Zn finger-like uncharacterized protein
MPIGFISGQENVRNDPKHREGESGSGMKITCPNCETSYNIGSNSVGPEGRSVRCSRCSQEWYIDSDGKNVAPPGADPADDTSADEDEWAAAFDDADSATSPPASDDDEGETAEAEPDEIAASGEDDWKSEIGLDGDDAPKVGGAFERDADFPLIDVEPEAFSKSEPLAELGAKTNKRKRRKRSTYDPGINISPEVRAMLGLGLFLLSIVLSVGVVLMREPIVRAAPSMAGLYSSVGLDVNLRGLEFHDLRTFQEYENGGVVLIVEGIITNTRRRSTHVPALQLALRSSDAQDIYTWTVEPRVRRLPAGQNLRFSTRVTSPPEIATDVHVNFVDRNNKQAKL